MRTGAAVLGRRGDAERKPTRMAVQLMLAKYLQVL